MEDGGDVSSVHDGGWALSHLAVQIINHNFMLSVVKSESVWEALKSDFFMLCVEILPRLLSTPHTHPQCPPLRALQLQIKFIACLSCVWHSLRFEKKKKSQMRTLAYVFVFSYRVSHPLKHTQSLVQLPSSSSPFPSLPLLPPVLSQSVIRLP